MSRMCTLYWDYWVNSAPSWWACPERWGGTPCKWMQKLIHKTLWWSARSPCARAMKLLRHMFLYRRRGAWIFGERRKVMDLLRSVAMIPVWESSSGDSEVTWWPIDDTGRRRRPSYHLPSLPPSRLRRKSMGQFWHTPLESRFLITFLDLLSSQEKRNRNYRNYGNWQEFLFLWK